MGNFWKEAVKVTGPVAVVGFILVFVIKNIFRQDVIDIFGSEQMFYLTIFILCILAVAFILSLVLYGGRPKSAGGQNEGGSRSISIDKSEVNGDVVAGDKIINQGHKRDE